MIEVRAFNGSATALSDYVIQTWEETYAGKMPVPQWSADYFQWQLQFANPDANGQVIAAYDGQTLAGLLAYFPMTFELNGQRIEAAQGSWLSVSSAYRRQGIAQKIHNYARQQLLQHECKFLLGYGYFGSRKSLGVKFWKKMQEKSTVLGAHVGFWARVLDPAKASRWNVNIWEGRMTALAAPLLFPPQVRDNNSLCIRPVVESDLPRCVELADLATQNCDLRLRWTPPRLGQQLGVAPTTDLQAELPADEAGSIAKGFVVEKDGEVKGCIGFHVLPIRGRTVEPVGIIDLIFVDELSSAEQGYFLNFVLAEMRKAGAVVALKLRTGDYPSRLFLRWGWFWKPADSQVLMTWVKDAVPLPKINKLHVLWR